MTDATPLWQRLEGANPTRVSFRAYALITAGMADGFTLEALLEHEAIDPRDWPVGEDHWNDCLLDDLPEGAVLTFELDAVQAREREQWVRAIPPLDQDYAAWLDFGRQLMASTDPAGMLLGIGLAPGDLGRLTRLWAGRCAEDNELNERRLEILDRPPDVVTVPRPAPPRFIDDNDSHVDGTGFFSAISEIADSLPFENATDDAGSVPTREPPSIATPLPEAARSSLDETALVAHMVGDLIGAAMPFSNVQPPPSPPQQTTPTPTAPAPGPAAPAPTAPAPAPASVMLPSDLGDEDIDATSMVVIDLGDVLPFEGTHAAPALAALPPDSEAGMTGVIPSLNIDATTPFGATTASAPSLEQLAAIAVEIELGTAPASVLTQYRLSDKSRDRAQADLERAMSRDAALHTRFEQAKVAYRAWRLGGAR